MPSNETSFVPAHSGGLTRLAFTHDGALIFTSGSDSMVRIFETAKGTDEEPRLLQEHQDEVGWLDCSSTHLLTSSTDSHLRLFTLPPPNQPSGPVTFSGLVSRAPGVPIRAGVLDKTGLRAAVASDDGAIKLSPTSSTSLHVPLTLPVSGAHTKPARALAWSPDGEVLLSTGGEGNLVVWDTSKSMIVKGKDEDEGEWEEPTVLKVFEGLVEAGEAEHIVSTTPVWHPGGKLFVVPSKSHEIQLFQRSTWSKVSRFHSETDGHDSVICELAFSPNGKYLASSGLDRKILVWEVETKKVIATHHHQDRITSLHFSPVSNLLAFADAEGGFTRWLDPIPSTHPHPAERFPTTNGAAAIVQRRARSPLFGDDELAVSPAKKAAGGVARRRGAGSDDEMEGEGGALDRDEPRSEDEGDGEYGEDWIIDEEEEGGAYGGLTKQKNAVERWAGEDAAVSRGGREVVNVTKAQPAFQPGSTPLRGKKRYLAFNMVGAIDITDQDTHHVVNVEFHDTSKRRAFHFQDHSKYEMAALGEKGAIFASLPDGTSPSTIHYRPFDSWSSSAEWSYDLPKGEAASAVAVGGKTLSSRDETTGTVVIATSTGYLRFLTGSGVQKYVWRQGEEVISMVGGGKEVLVVSREGGTSLDGCQNLRYTLIDLDSFELVQEGRLPLGKGTTLSWVGFAEDGIPAIYDSKGILSTLDRFRRPGQARWVPALDSTTLARREGKDESYWAVGVQDGKFMAVILKGREKDPYFPRPLISDLDINMPLLNMSNSAGQLEENFMRQSIEALAVRDSLPPTTYSSDSDTLYRLELSMDKHLLQLIQTACKADKLPRALDAARMLNSVKSIDSAVQIAGFYHLPGLKEKIGGLREGKEREIRRREEDERRRRYGGGGGGALSRFVSSTGAESVDSQAAPKPNRNPLEFAPRPVKRTFAAAAPPTSSSPATSLDIRSVTSSYAPAPESSAVDRDGDEEMMEEDEALAPVGDESDEETQTQEEESQAAAAAAAAAAKRKRDANGGFDPVPSKKSRPSLDSMADSSPAPVKAAPVVNPFARKTLAKQAEAEAAAAGPFAKSNALAKSASIAKSNSFFERVDERPSKPAKKDKKATDPKQSKLVFGKKPLVSEPKKMAPPPPASAEAEEEQTMDEDEWPPSPPPKRKSTLVDEDVEEEEEEEEEMEEETQKSPPPPPAKTKKSAPPANGDDDGAMSAARGKLAQFKHREPAAAAAVEAVQADAEQETGQEVEVEVEVGDDGSDEE